MQAEQNTMQHTVPNIVVNFGFPFCLAEAVIGPSSATLHPLWPPVKDAALATMPLCGEFHSHGHYEMIYVLEGAFTEHLEHSTYILNPGEATFLNSNIRHLEGRETECRFLFFNFLPGFLGALFARTALAEDPGQHRSTHVRDFCLEDQGRRLPSALDFRRRLSPGQAPGSPVTDTIERLRTALGEARTGYAFAVQGLLLELFQALEDPAAYHITRIQEKSDTADVMFSEIRHYLLERHGRVSLQQLAGLIHYHPDYISRIVRKKTGMNYTGYCRHLWLEKAKELLLGTDMGIGEIIYLLGYESTNTFYRVFHQATGLTPVEFRRQATQRDQTQ